MSSPELEREVSIAQTLLTDLVEANKKIYERIYLTGQQMRLNHQSGVKLIDLIEENVSRIDRNTESIEQAVGKLHSLYDRFKVLENSIDRLTKKYPGSDV
jgi:acetolactate synthase small subunit